MANSAPVEVTRGQRQASEVGDWVNELKGIICALKQWKRPRAGTYESLKGANRSNGKVKARTYRIHKANERDVWVEFETNWEQETRLDKATQGKSGRDNQRSIKWNPRYLNSVVYNRIRAALRKVAGRRTSIYCHSTVGETQKCAQTSSNRLWWSWIATVLQ